MIRECEEAAGAPTSPAWCEVVEACMIVESMLELLCMFLRYATVCSFGFHYSRAVQSMAVLYHCFQEQEMDHLAQMVTTLKEGWEANGFH